MQIAIPFLIPLIWGIVIKRTPSWSGWTTVVVGFAVSVSSLYIGPEIGRKLMGLDSPIRPREW